MIKVLGRLALAAVIVALLAAVALGSLALSAWPLDGASLAIDGDSISLAGLPGWHVTAAIAAVAAAVCIALLAAAGAVVLALLAVALGIAVALFATVGSFALVLSPLLVVAWIVWRIVRSDTTPRPMSA